VPTVVNAFTDIDRNFGWKVFFLCYRPTFQKAALVFQSHCTSSRRFLLLFVDTGRVSGRPR